MTQDYTVTNENHETRIDYTSTDPVISVIVPVYRVEKYLQDCIDSLLSQTLQSIEYIFVDDASPDSCGMILDQNAEKHPDKFKVIHLSENKCLGGARNEGIKIARGKYIGFVDSDDMVLPQMYELLYNEVQKSDSDAAFVLSTRITSEMKFSEIPDFTDGTALNSAKPYVDFKPINSEYNGIEEMSDKERERLYVNVFTGSVWAAIWKKSILIENDIHFPEHLFYEDFYWLALVIPYLHSVHFIESIQHLYRINYSGITHKASLQSINQRIISEHKAITELKKRGLFEKYRDGIEYRAIELFARNTYWMTIKYSRGFGTFFKSQKYIRTVEKEFRSLFPNWYNNPYYVEFASPQEKESDSKIVNSDFCYYLKSRIIYSPFVRKIISKIRKKK